MCRAPCPLGIACGDRGGDALTEGHAVLAVGLTFAAPVAVAGEAVGNQFLGRIARQTGIADQPGQRPRRIGAARKAEDVNLVPRLIVFSQMHVGERDLVIETDAHRAA